MFELTSENLTDEGGAMGQGSSWTNWRKFFKDSQTAMDCAQNDYKDGKINWKTHGSGWNSGDLVHVMYRIKSIKIEN